MSGEGRSTLHDQSAQSQVGKFERVASQEREDFPRFRYLFESGELLPPAVFMQALELGAYESLG